MKTRFFAFIDGKFELSKETVPTKEGDDIDEVWEKAGYQRFISYGGRDLPVLEVWRLKDEETSALPLFLATLSIDDYFHEIRINTLPDLMMFCQEVQPYVSLVASQG